MDPLRTLFRHHAWATLTLIDHCRSLSAERLAESTSGTYGGVMDTLVHLVAADQRYLYRMDGQSAQPRVHETAPATLNELHDAVEAQAARWQALVDRASELDVTIPAGTDWPEIPNAEDLLFRTGHSPWQ